MSRIVLIKIGEMALKKGNRDYFESVFYKNLKKALSSIECKVRKTRGRYYIEEFSESDLHDIESILKKISGLVSFSSGYQLEKNMDDLISFASGIVNEIENMKDREIKTFKFIAKREDKSFPLNSYEICCKLGEVFLDNSKILKVDVKNPDVKIRVEVRDSIYLYFNEIKGLGGLPNGVSGKGLLMLSGGIDSPVAGIMMAKRGMKLNALHFLSPPYTGELAKDKVSKLAALIKPFSPGMTLIMVSVTKILENISQYCKDSYSTILLRVFMVKIANRIAQMRNCKAIISGESLSQVASQTIDGLTVSDSQRELLILRPLIGMDKSDIIDLARHYETFDTSIIQAEDCCTVFLPKHPVTRPSIKDVMAEYNKIPDTDILINSAIDQAITDKMN